MKLRRPTLEEFDLFCDELADRAAEEHHADTPKLAATPTRNPLDIDELDWGRSTIWDTAQEDRDALEGRARHVEL